MCNILTSHRVLVQLIKRQARKLSVTWVSFNTPLSSFSAGFFIDSKLHISDDIKRLF